MEIVFSIGAALRSERVKTAKRINQCGSFVKLAVAADGLKNLWVDEGRNIISFDCENFEFDERESSKNWKKLFPHKRDGKCVVINVPDKYVVGRPIRGYH